MSRNQSKSPSESSSCEGCVKEFGDLKSSASSPLNFKALTECYSGEMKARATATFQDGRPFFSSLFLNVKVDKLQIPRHFEKHLSDWSDIAVLKTVSGKSWNVKTCQTQKGLFLVDGWQQFSRDISLSKGDLMTFAYDGSMQFTVRIYGKSGPEKTV